MTNLKCFFIYCFTSVMSNLSFAQVLDSNRLFELKGVFMANQGLKQVYLYYKNDDGSEEIDSTAVVNNIFYFSGNISCPIKAFLGNSKKFRLDGTSATIVYLEPYKMIMTFPFVGLNEFSITGSPTQIDYQRLKKLKIKNQKGQDSINSLIEYNKLKLQQNLSEKEGVLIEKKNNKLILLQIDKNTIDLETELYFVKQNPKSFLSIDLLLNTLQRRVGTPYFNQVEKLSILLDNKLKVNKRYNDLEYAILNFKQNQVGNAAPNINCFDLKNQTVKLSDYVTKKVVLLDFWASWCVPCREEFNFLRQLLNKYQNEDFEIIGLSIDKDDKAWNNAIEKDQIAIWRQILIKNCRSDKTMDVSNSYSISAIPVKVLIDKNGKIIGRWRGGGLENQNELESLLTKIFTK